MDFFLFFLHWLWWAPPPKKKANAYSHDERCGADGVVYFFFTNAELLFLQDTIKAEAYHRPIRGSSGNTELRSKTGLSYVTATETESNYIPLLVWAQPVVGRFYFTDCVLVSVEVLRPIFQTIEPCCRFSLFPFLMKLRFIVFIQGGVEMNPTLSRCIESHGEQSRIAFCYFAWDSTCPI